MNKIMKANPAYMFYEKEYVKDYNYIQNLLNLIYHHQIMVNYFQIKLYGLWMIHKFIELQFIKHLKAI